MSENTITYPPASETDSAPSESLRLLDISPTLPDYALPNVASSNEPSAWSKAQPKAPFETPDENFTPQVFPTTFRNENHTRGIFGSCPTDSEHKNRVRAVLPENAIAGLKFRDYGPVFYCLAGGIALAIGDFVMADCEQGLGKVMRILESPPEDLSVLLSEPMPGPQNLSESLSAQPQHELPRILRLANSADLAILRENSALAIKAGTSCRENIREMRLDMKLVDVEIYHDRSKMVFYFTAPTRIDFRELVKELVKSYRTRIELRQIGVRHETQMLGGIGNCGMVCCCRRYLRRFAPVTIKMAKEQNLFLNPAKISGLCGRLLCCLSYEQENYENFHRLCPKIGKRYQTDQGAFKVLRVNMFRTSIIVLPEEGEEMELSIDEWKALHPGKGEVAKNDAPKNEVPKNDALQTAKTEASGNSGEREQPRRPKPSRNRPE